MTDALLSRREAAVLADDIEAQAFADLYAAAPAALSTQLGLQVRDIAGASALMAPGLPDTMFNRAIGLGLHRPASTPDVAQLQAAYRAAGIGAWWLHWNPVAQPAQLCAQLPALGFTVPRRRSWAKVMRGREGPPEIATDLQIAPVVGGPQADAAVEAIVQAFGMPPFMTGWLRALYGRPHWTLYAVSDGADVVGGGCLFVQGGTGWLGMGSVLPSHRRRGGQGALMGRRTADVFAAGCTRVVTETGEAIADEPNPSLANMKRCGFETVASRLNFLAPA